MCYKQKKLLCTAVIAKGRQLHLAHAVPLSLPNTYQPGDQNHRRKHLASKYYKLRGPVYRTKMRRYEDLLTAVSPQKAIQKAPSPLQIGAARCFPIPQELTVSSCC